MEVPLYSVLQEQHTNAKASMESSTVSVTSLPELLEGGRAMPAMKLNANGGANRDISMALASREYADVWPGTSR